MKKKINFSFSKNNLVYKPSNTSTFRKYIKNILNNRKYNKHLTKFQKNYYVENNDKTMINKEIILWILQ